ncbi:hypothetical protein [uncultured Porphyromonas sp.]|nr:hypothetical protein [uncultured Porphyromonas sp.]
MNLKVQPLRASTISTRQGAIQLASIRGSQSRRLGVNDTHPQ